MDKKLDELAGTRVSCIQEFASKASVNEAFTVLRDHSGRIAALESWRKTKSRGEE